MISNVASEESMRNKVACQVARNLREGVGIEAEKASTRVTLSVGVEVRSRQLP